MSWLSSLNWMTAMAFCISAISGDGCRTLTYALQAALDTLAPPPPVRDEALDAHFPDITEFPDNSDPIDSIDR